MSDGPDGTLEMREGWRQVAKWASLDAYDAQEVCGALVRAVEQDWRAEDPGKLVAAIRQIFGDGRQVSLLADQRLDQLERLRPSAIGSPLRTVLIDCAMQVMAEGMDGPEGLQEAVKRAIADQALSGCRKVEDHYRGATDKTQALSIRRRLETAIAACEFGALAAQLLGAGRAPAVSRPPKQTGLDEGPRV